ncbi:hypothetical protein [Halolamina salifodinae]|uniref:Big-1 domain-containing protein n=1 Tax=Halolamina salifodinae TaxID=1202767 RepID=A0A8T4GRV3_9EURY|nr:hypothetical protein [Halolamina salifodinae]MBP1985757.1 hypothetical protein [Halolamina salifodinae]
MDFWGDDRGQSIQVGAILLFAFLIIAMATYQAQVVPSSNTAVEFEHTQQVEREFIDLRSSVLTAARTGNPQSTVLTLGMRYPQRTFFVNPPPAAGAVSTSSDRTLRIENASVSGGGNVEAFWNTRSLSFNTQSIRYVPRYNGYDNPPELMYENSMVVAEFDQAVLARAGQTVVENDELSLTLIDGNLSETGVGSRSIDTQVLSQNTRSVNVESTGGPIVLILPTTVDGAEKRATLAQEWEREIETDANVTALDNESAIRIELTDTDVSLRLAQIGVGTDTAQTDEAGGYITVVGDTTVAPGEKFTVEVRDRFNNPVSDAEVTPDSGLSPTRTGENGRVTFSLDEPSGNSETVELSVNDGNETWETVNVTVSQSAGGGDGGAGSGSVSNYSEGSTNDTFSSANGRWVGITCTDQLLLSDGQPASRPNGNKLQGDVIRLSASLNDSTGESYTMDIKLARASDGSWNKKKVVIYDGNGNNVNAELTVAAAARIYESGETDILELSTYKDPDTGSGSFSDYIKRIRALDDDSPVDWQTSRMTGRVDVALECDPPPSSGVSTVDGTTPSGESSALQFDIQVPSGTTETVTDIKITTPGNRNSDVQSANKLKRGSGKEVVLTVSDTSGVNQSGDLNTKVKLDGTKYALDTDATFSDGAVLSVDMGDIDGGKTQWTYDLVDSQSKADVVVTFYFQDGTQFKAYLKVTNVSS